MNDVTRQPPNVVVLNDWIAEKSRRQFEARRQPPDDSKADDRDDDGGDAA